MKLRLSLMLLISMGAIGCHFGADKDIQAVKNTITRYDQLLAEGYAKMNMTPLREVATEERASKAYYYMAALGETGLKMDSILGEAKFLGVQKTSVEKAEVKVEERWDYKYLDIKTGKPLFDNTVTYLLTYRLVKNRDRWLVADINIEKAEEKKSSAFIFQRPHDKELRKPEGK